MTQTAFISRSSILAAVLLAAFASQSFAGKIKITGHADYRAGLGGEFNVAAYDAGGAALLAASLASGYVGALTDVAGTADGAMMKASSNASIGFQTFCLEYSEHISLGGIYDAEIGTAAFGGGVGIGGGPTSPRSDPVSEGTAYLYNLFAKKKLAGYHYANGAARAADAVMLQNAFWYLEHERTLAEIGGGNVFLTLALNKFGGDLNAKANSTKFNVGVINLYSGSVPSQSQLIMLPVPDGGVTGVLLGLALSGLALVRRKSH